MKLGERFRFLLRGEYYFYLKARMLPLLSENESMLLKKIASGNYEEIDIRFTDILGYWRHVTLPAGQVTDSLLTRGVGFDGSTMEAMTKTEAGDLAVVPDTRVVYEDPFADRPTIFVLADIVHPDSGKSFSKDPRGVARRADRFVKNSGIAAETFWAPEFEFYLFNKARFWSLPGRIGYEIDSAEAPWQSEFEESKGLVHTTSSGYDAMFPIDRLHKVRAEIARVMQKTGIQVKYHHHEVGRMGQVEVEVSFAPFLSTADSIMLTKHIIRNVALKNGLASTFMPKPLPGEPGSGLHFHIYFVSNGERVFYSKDGYYHLSDVALNAIAGVLYHAPALCAFTNASVNSYQRLVPKQEAPVYRFFSGPNRTAAIRVPAYAYSPESMRFEYRVPDAAGNPYLCMAAILMGAADGIKRQLDPGRLGFGPIDENVFQEDFDTSKLATLPRSLDEALDGLLHDRAFLEQEGVFPPDLIDEYVGAKRRECAIFRGNPHPLEHKLYFGL